MAPAVLLREEAHKGTAGGLQEAQPMSQLSGQALEVSPWPLAWKRQWSPKLKYSAVQSHKGGAAGPRGLFHCGIPGPQLRARCVLGSQVDE